MNVALPVLSFSISDFESPSFAGLEGAGVEASLLRLYELMLSIVKLAQIEASIRLMADEIEQVLLRFGIDKPALREAIAANDLVAKRLTRLGAESEIAEKEVKKLRESLGNLKGDQADRARVLIARLDEQLAKAKDEAGRLARKLEDIPTEKTVEVGVQERFDTVSRQVGLAGDIQSNLGALRGLTDIAGLGGVSGAIGGAGEVVALIEELPRLKTAISGLPATAQAAASALGTNVTTLGAFGVALAGVTVALELAKQMAEQTQVSTRALINTQQEYYDILAGGTVEDAKSALERAKQELESAKLQREELLRIQEQAFKDAQAQQGDFGARLSFFAARAFNVAGINDMDARINELNQTIADNELLVGRLSGAIQEGNLPSEEAAKAEEDLAKKREQALATIAQLEAQQSQIISQANLQRKRTLEDREIREAQQMEDHMERMGAIETQGRERILAIRQQGIDKIAQIDGQIKKLNGTMADVNADFMASEIQRVQKLADDLRKMDEQANKQRIRRLEDLNDELLDAEAANDVNRFIEAQRRGETDLRRMKEDADEQTRRRLEQAEEERRLAEEQRQRRLADIQAQIDEQNRAKQETILAIQTQLIEEKNRIAAAEAAQQAAFDKAQAREAAADKLRDERQAEDLAAQLKAIDDKIAAEQEAAGIINTTHVAAAQQAAGIINTTHVAAAQQAAASVWAAWQQGYASFSATASAAFAEGGTPPPTPFAEGGIATRPTLGLLGERPGWGDVVIPFRKSAGPESALAQRGGITLSFGDINLGGISRAEFDAGMTLLAAKVVSGVQMAVG